MKKILFNIGVIVVGIFCLGVLMNVFSIGLRFTLFGAKLLIAPVAAMFLIYILVYFLFIRKNR